MTPGGGARVGRATGGRRAPPLDAREERGSGPEAGRREGEKAIQRGADPRLGEPAEAHPSGAPVRSATPPLLASRRSRPRPTTPLGRARRGGPLTALSLVALLASAVASGQVPGSRTRVEGVAAWVGPSGRPGSVAILRSDVVLRARMRLAGRVGRAQADALPAALLRAALDELVGEVLIEREADRLHAARPSDAEVAEERARLAREAGGPEVLAALVEELGADDEELDRIARRRSYVDAFLRANLEGTTEVSDAQVERAYAAGDHPFAGRPLEDVREPLRAWIQQRILSRDVARWIEVLRGRTSVRVLAEWSRDE